jgi:hypothetical protein
MIRSRSNKSDCLDGDGGSSRVNFERRLDVQEGGFSTNRRTARP